MELTCYCYRDNNNQIIRHHSILANKVHDPTSQTHAYLLINTLAAVVSAAIVWQYVTKYLAIVLISIFVFLSCEIKGLEHYLFDCTCIRNRPQGHIGLAPDAWRLRNVRAFFRSFRPYILAAGMSFVLAFALTNAPITHPSDGKEWGDVVRETIPYLLELPIVYLGVYTASMWVALLW